MSQLSLFDSPRPAPERRPPNPDFIRKHLNHALRLLRRADRMPWSEPETRNWEERFPELVGFLPEEEGLPMLEEFRSEVERLRSCKR